jgi:hypothetical protein
MYFTEYSNRRIWVATVNGIVQAFGDNSETRYYGRTTSSRRLNTRSAPSCYTLFTQLFLILISNRVQNFRIHNTGSIEHRT